MLNTCTLTCCWITMVVALSPMLSAQQQTYVKPIYAEEDDRFGSGLAIAGSTVAIGAHGESSSARGINGEMNLNNAPASGAVFLFEHDGVRWNLDTFVKATNPDIDDQFGRIFDLDANTLVVSTNYEDSSATGIDGNEASNSALQSGAAYVYVRHGGTWKDEAYLKASNAEANDQFGISIALSGDRVAIGAWGESSAAGADGSDNSEENAGAVYVFVRHDGEWEQEALVKASNAEAGDRFGRNIDLAGDTLVVGAGMEDSAATGMNGDRDDNSAEDAGAVYLFERVGGAWVQQAYLKASNTDPGDEFGSAVELADDANTLAVAARRERGDDGGVNGDQSSNALSNAGAVYLFERSGETWAQTAYIKAGVPGSGDGFGQALSLAGDRLLVTAGGEDSAATVVNGGQDNDNREDSGAAYILTRVNGNWEHTWYLKAHHAEQQDTLGVSAALSDDWALVGCFREASGIGGPGIYPLDNSAPGAGAVYSHDLVNTAWTTRGAGLAGVRGNPQLLGAGPLTASSNNELRLSNAAPFSTAAIFLALDSNPVAFKGGILKTFPVQQTLIATTNFQGMLTVGVQLPPEVSPDIELWLQAAIADDIAPVGIALSNALLGRTP
ncbi:MAG: hypothetical protein DHS20C15_08230 [Planctomycetota bacterium]|nr:MAG: hypothetical protein DHS20C15_08230 [Planctomycetota bacterium]